MTPPPSTTTGSAGQAAKRPTCARCRREHTFYRHWPEGHLCRTCVLAALTIHGVCPGCGDHRILPGRDPAGDPICPACAGIRRSVFRCRRCGVEGRPYHGKLCVRCTLADRVAAVLDNGTGHIDPALAPLATALITAATPTPTGRLAWLRKPHNRDLLRALATAALPLTHDALTDHPDQTGVGYLPALLVDCGALPEIDPQLVAYQTWLS